MQKKLYKREKKVDLKLLWCIKVSLILFPFYCHSCNNKTTTTHKKKVPRTELIGDSDRYVKAGSTVKFRCVVIGALEQPSYIIWHHGLQQIYVENRRGWKIQFDREMEGDSHSSVRRILLILFFFISSHFVLLL
jgi:hypothetical protein